MVNYSRNVIYIFSICFLFLCTCCLLFGYLICTDKTIYANTQVPEISVMNPGFVSCFDLNTNIYASKQSRISIMFYGDQSIQKPQINNNKDNTNCIRYYLGTDRYGRDVYSRIIIGIRYTLIVGSIAVLFNYWNNFRFACWIFWWKDGSIHFINNKFILVITNYFISFRYFNGIW